MFTACHAAPSSMRSRPTGPHGISTNQAPRAVLSCTESHHPPLWKHPRPLSITTALAPWLQKTDSPTWVSSGSGGSSSLDAGPVPPRTPLPAAPGPPTSPGSLQPEPQRLPPLQDLPLQSHSQTHPPGARPSVQPLLHSGMYTPRNYWPRGSPTRSSGSGAFPCRLHPARR